MPGQLLRLSDRLLNTPLLIHPAKAQIILGALSGRIGFEASLFSAEDGMDAPDANRFHTPPSKGQQFTALSPNGDWQQAVALPMTWSDQNQSPSSNGDENVLTYGNVTATIKDGLCEVVVGAASLKLTSAAVTIKVGGVNVEITDSGVAITGGKVTHDGKNIGSTHLHGGVVPGGGLTDVPAN